MNMKRDIDLIRKLLLYFDEKPDDHMVECPQVEGYTDLQIRYHLILMYEAGFLRCEKEVTETGRIIKVYPFSLTWSGHEFINAAKDDSLWAKAKDKFCNGTASFTFDIILEWLKASIVSS